MVEGENRVRKGEGEGKSLLLTWRAWSQMEGADKEEWREENNTYDVIQEALFFCLSTCFIINVDFCFLSFPRSITLWGCCLTRLAVSKLSSVSLLHLHLSFLPLRLSTEIKAHTVEAFTSSPKNSPRQKRSDFPPSLARAEWEMLGCGWAAERGRGCSSHSHIKGLCAGLTVSRGATQHFILCKGSHPHTIFHPPVLGWGGGVTENKEEKARKLKEKGEWIWLKLAANRSVTLSSFQILSRSHHLCANMAQHWPPSLSVVGLQET